MYTDPVCGMEIDRSDAVAESDYDGETYYFCSKECKRKFDAEPDRYAEGGPEVTGGMAG
jgi:uncharacterized protein